jgi:hypothetical protein
MFGESNLEGEKDKEGKNSLSGSSVILLIGSPRYYYLFIV